MKRALLLFFLLVLPLYAADEPKDIDAELEALAGRLAASIKARNLKKVTILDFTDLQQKGSELGKYIADQLTVDLVSENPSFAILDRVNLTTILKEHKLTATGLVDPENAKKIGMFAGLDAIVIGTIVPKKNSIALTARIITTDTAEVAGATRGEFRQDETTKSLLETPSEGGASGGSGNDGPGVTRTVGDLAIVFQNLRIVNGREYLLTLSFTNRSSRKSTWVNLNEQADCTLLNPQNHEIYALNEELPGTTREARLVEIKPKGSLDAILKFKSNAARPLLGQCRIQMELYITDSYNGPEGSYPTQQILANVEAK